MKYIRALNSGLRLLSDYVYKVVALIILLFPLTTANSAEPEWPSGDYRYIVIDQDLRKILVQFGRNLNINVKLSERVTSRRIQGKMPNVSAKEFLELICSRFGLVWYYNQSTLHVYSEEELDTAIISLGNVSAGRLTSNLEKLGIADSRYSVQATDDTKTVRISGPPHYLALVRQAVAAMEQSLQPAQAQEVPYKDDVKIRVFRGGREGS